MENTTTTPCNILGFGKLFKEDLLTNPYLWIGGIIFLYNITINLAMIFGIYKTKIDKTLSNKLCIFLCVTNITIAFNEITLYILASVNISTKTCISINKCFFYFTVWVDMMQMQFLWLFVILQYIAIKMPFQSKPFIQVYFTGYKSLTMWFIVSIVIANIFPIVILTNLDIIHTIYPIYGSVVILSLACMVAVNIHLVCKLKEMSKKPGISNNKQVRQRYKNTVLTLLLVSITMILLQTPRVVVTFFVMIHMHKIISAYTPIMLLLEKLLGWSSVLYLLNTAIYTHIFLHRKNSIRVFYKNLFIENFQCFQVSNTRIFEFKERFGFKHRVQVENEQVQDGEVFTGQV